LGGSSLFVVIALIFGISELTFKKEIILCGYHMGDYFRRWINLGKKADPSKLPRIFCVNWFRKTADGKWLWPGIQTR
jgi:hypothetical protein